MSGPLQGLRVLDLTTVLMGPYATQLMADMGADVVKIEPPGGDTVRGIGPMRNPGMGHIFLHVNRNKRSLVLDLKQADGLAAFYRLAETADVVIYNIRPQAMRRLGIDYERLQAINPRIIYAGLYGYSETGPYAGKPAYDDLIQGAAAVPSIMSMASGERPRYVPLTLADRTVGLMASTTILAAVVSRAQTGLGQQIEIPMFETMVQYVLSDHLSGETFVPAKGPSGYPRLLVKERRPYQTQDGYLCVLIYNDKHWRGFVDRVQPDWNTREFDTLEQRAHRIDTVYGLVAQTLKERTTEEWLGLFRDLEIPAAPINTLDALFDDPHLNAVGLFETVETPHGPVRFPGVPTWFSRTPGRVQGPAPELGADTETVLAELQALPRH